MEEFPILFGVLGGLLLFSGIYMQCKKNNMDLKIAYFVLFEGLAMLSLALAGVLLDDPQPLLYASISIFGSFLGGLGVIDLINRKCCTLPVTATCVELRHGYRSSRVPVFKYRYNGKDYHSGGRGVIGFRKYYQVGAALELYINEKHPHICYDKRRGNGTTVFMLVVGLVFFAVGVYAVVGTF